MSTLFVDDITGTEYDTQQYLQNLGIALNGELVASIDVTAETIRDHPDAIRDELDAQLETALDELTTQNPQPSESPK